MVPATQMTAAAEIDRPALVQAADSIDAALLRQGDLPIGAIIAIRQQNIAAFEVMLQGVEQGRFAGLLAAVGVSVR